MPKSRLSGSVANRNIVYIALGSNLGEREKFLSDAREAIAGLPGTRCVARTPVEETAAIGPVKQGSFLNQMVAVETELEPEELLAHLQAIEERAGRARGERWGPRTLDLDIVAADGRAMSDPGLVVPHPELPNRDFWLRELAFLRQCVERPSD
jgi:2-amino-4-hydroxy-6-hydroxymethyldihydropteridine diphosphokinase